MINQTDITNSNTNNTNYSKNQRSEYNLIWVDMEMTGLNPDTDKIIEVAVVITDSHLNIIAESPSYAIKQKDEILAGMDKWNQSTHGRSGLIDRVKTTENTEQSTEKELLEFIKKYTYAQKSPMCGNSICQDRRFMYRYMPKLEAYFHYRNVDVSTLKELAKRWKADIIKGFEKKQLHTALADIHESIQEMAYYKQHFINI
jgi:oligoribonuclease